ncbi:twin-arginine translocase subunit TatB [Oricola thermophila]|uniref:Sec-independent protein translocase protein TatB n=1 Tax=Oricola thermophila TaxID=2742145 RepID=A0A6N1VM63_9HYPH|nr:twin-arginine translocase subunit TatB [Oricola thermophila]
MPDFGWSELLVVAIVLIVIVGPKDLPKMLRTFAKTTSGLRKMAGDFRRQFDDALKEAELDDVRQLAQDVKSLDPRNEIKQALNPLGKIGEDLSADLKRAARDVDDATKPPSPADDALASAGEKMRAAQPKTGKAKTAGEAKGTKSKTAAAKAKAPSHSAAGSRLAGTKGAKASAQDRNAAGGKTAGSTSRAKSAGKSSAARPAAGKASGRSATAKPAAATAKPKSKTATRAASRKATSAKSAGDKS